MFRLVDKLVDISKKMKNLTPFNSSLGHIETWEVEGMPMQYCWMF